MEVKELDRIGEAERAIEALEPSTPAYEVRMNLLYPDGAQREVVFIQAEIGFLPAQRFFTRVSREIKSFVDGEYGIKLGELFSGGFSARAMMPSEMTEGAVNKVVSDNQQMIEAFLKLVDIVPEFQADVMALSLGVPRGDVDWFKDAIEEPPHRGGLTIADGFELLRRFIRQNAVALRRFFEEEGKSLVAEFDLWVVHEGVKQVILDDEKEVGPGMTEPDTSTPGGRPSSTSSQATPASVS